MLRQSPFDVSDVTTERIQRNNTVFREANERIAEAAERYDHRLERIPFLCECPVESCLDIVRLSRDEYSAVRASERRFLTAVGHEDAEGSVAHVVERNDGYIVVEKHGS